MLKVHRAYCAAARGLGADVERLDCGRKHSKLWLRHECRTAFFTISSSPSDSREMKNFVARIRRWLDGRSTVSREKE